MEALSGLDASFLWLESPRNHMHVGSVIVVEGSLQYTRFHELLARRIHRVPRMRQRLVAPPLGLDAPYWVDDPEFRLEMHLQHVALPRPGGWRELRRLAARLFSEPLDRSRPLWEMVFVEGLDTIPQVPPGSVAMIGKVHHAAIDGVSGADIMSILFDITADPPPDDAPPPFNPPPIPADWEVAQRSAVNLIKRPLRLPQLIFDSARSAMKTGALTRGQEVDLPTLPFTAPPTRLNGQISAQRTWNTALLSLDRVKEIKQIMGCTLNDVVLAICGGALRRYLEEKEDLPNRPLVAIVPVSTRISDQRGHLGNQVSAMFIQLATDIADPVDRLRQIRRNTVSGKAYQDAIGARTLADYAEFIPFGLAGQAARLYSRMRVAEMHRPIFNLIITNVPGPQTTLYVAGHKLLAVMGMGPLYDGMGLIIPVLSYNGVLSISPTSDVKTMPDIDRFARYLRESANQLEAEVLKLRPPEVKPPLKTAEPPSTAWFIHMQRHLHAHPDFVQAGTGVFQFEVTGDDTRTWTIDLSTPPGVVQPGAAEHPDATFTIEERHLLRVLRGDLDVQIAFMQGKLRVQGDIGRALKLGQLLTQIPPLAETG